MRKIIVYAGIISACLFSFVSCEESETVNPDYNILQTDSTRTACQSGNCDPPECPGC